MSEPNAGRRLTPPEEILAFIARQPQTIRAMFYFTITFPFSDDATKPDTHYQKLAHDIFDLKGLDLSTRSVMVAALIDFFLSKPHAPFKEIYEHIPSFERSQHLTSIYLQTDLQRKHYEQAANEWAHLRQSNLSLEALRQFEGMILAESFRH